MSDKATVGRLILIPALITLGVTALRLVGELQHWDPRFFSRAPGGAGAIVGIVWLVPIFGIYFARKLVGAGRGPSGAGRALGLALVGLAVIPAAIFLARALKLPVLGVAPLLFVASLIAAYVAFRGWPALGGVLLAYGVAARIPVAALMLVAMKANWGTHYELGPAGLPPMGLFTRWLLTGLLPQLTFWIGFTVAVGAIFGSVAVLLTGRTRAAGPALAPTGQA
jgi:hypothetical protein